MRIALVGPYPPPYGGISVHIQRLEALLKCDGQEVVVFPNVGAREWCFGAWGRWFDYDVVHFHDISWKSRVEIGLMGAFGLKVVLTIHGDSLMNQLTTAGWLRRSLLAFSMRHITHIVSVKAEIRDLLLSLGIKPSHVSIVNAYLPPVCDHTTPVAPSISEFVESHAPLVVANGFGAIPLSERSDLYGIEMTLDLCAQLAENYRNLGCLFFLAQIGNQNRYDKLIVKVSKLGMTEHFRFIIGENLVPVLGHATVFVRPTFQDGYGVSIAEALHLGVPAVASDVCTRPEGTHVFKCGDLDDFYRQTRKVLDGYPAAKEAILEHPPASAYEALMAIYRQLSSKR